MTRARLSLLFGALPALAAWLGAQRPDQAPPRAKPREELLATGKKLFVERCASCHGERGDRPLRTGLPLSRRKLAIQQIEKAVNGRFRDKTESKRRGVTLYIRTLVAP